MIDDADNSPRSPEKEQVKESCEPVPSIVKVPHSIYSAREKWFIVGVVAAAGLLRYAAVLFVLSSVSAANVLSAEQLNLTVTVYLVLQGVSLKAPMVWGPFADSVGRRPVFLVCITILILSCVGLALTPASAFWLLLLLRCVQSAGCASTIALGAFLVMGAGVIGDISEPFDRGSHFGMFNLGPMLAPNIGPTIGGALSQHLGWRSIFWFLAIFAFATFIFVFLYESYIFIPLQRRMIMFSQLSPRNPTSFGRGRRIQPFDKTKSLKRPFRNPLLLFAHPDVCISLLFTGVVYAVNYSITATISSSFASVYPFLSETAIGLCFLTTGAGMIIGSTLTGKFLDWEYGNIRCQIETSHLSNMDLERTDGGAAATVDFPIEKARLRTMPIHLGVFVVCTIAWGWCLQAKVSIAGPLVLQVALGCTSISILNTTMTLMLDLLPSQSSSVTACTNLVRCSLAAVLVSVVDMATSALGYGWTYVVLGGICAAMLPLILLEMKIGPAYRLKRLQAASSS
ncbi:hypothetical protein EW146_g1639 [Bondarzewia mesenterica]|uniref:Major facilitator superfamily (MFS) profile domain-containing protein n=1 Tax=Bondarzewia mesenterica TaxID=1095465 RepID=A0A4S4M4N2_9AGAM|nr:hypothetical protein EW146_g1639 [Bondarzewia mesenterica]